MMNSFEVKIFGKSVGALGIDKGTTYFEYAEAFKKENLEIYPLKLSTKNTRNIL